MNVLRILPLILALGLAAAQERPLATMPAETWQPGRLIEAEHLERWTASLVQQRAGTQPVIENDVDLWRLVISTTGPDGEPVPVTAQLFVPVNPPGGASPLFVYGSGTTGVGQVCAPSREHLLPEPLGAYRELLAPYAGRGFVTVIPDYLGYDIEGSPQLYFHALSEAHVLLDTARAVREFFLVSGRDGELQPHVFYGGYSQGGHAAFAVADHYADYAPEAAPTGVIGFAATTDVQALMREAAYYTPYILHSYRQVYGAEAVDPAEVLGSQWLQRMETVAATDCVDRIQQVFPADGGQLYTADFWRALLLEDLNSVTPGLAAALAENNTGLSGHGLPALVIQGGHDVIVSDGVQERFVAALCQAGSRVQYVNYPAARHRGTRTAGFEASVAWMKQLLEPEAVAPDNC